MPMWIISRGAVLLILLMEYKVLRDFLLHYSLINNSARLSNKFRGFYFSFKFDISDLLHHVITTIAYSIQDKDTSQSKKNLQSSSMTFIHKTLIIPSVLDSCFISYTVSEVKRLIQLMHTTMVPEQVKTMKIQAGIQVSRPGELKRQLQLWKRFGRLYLIVFVLVRNIRRDAFVRFVLLRWKGWDDVYTLLFVALIERRDKKNTIVLLLHLIRRRRKEERINHLKTKSRYVSDQEATDDEIGFIMKSNTWVLSDLPPGCKPLGCKCIFKRKMKVDGTIDKFKSRLHNATSVGIQSQVVFRVAIAATLTTHENDERGGPQLSRGCWNDHPQRQHVQPYGEDSDVKDEFKDGCNGGRRFGQRGVREFDYRQWAKDVSTFHGSMNVEDFLDWISELDTFFKFYEIPMGSRVDLIAYKLKWGAQSW
ncbi:hypothetical protein Tco_1028737 [Tanacetum coccineum]|uniref:Uncharacterized protein n=1 Tax=Tanacetum coccineum TaxID=301880 RepID=A0ABQ5G1F3_9ASTR